MRRISSNSESGAILLIVIILMLALTITGIAFLNAGVMENRLVWREIHKNQAFYLAEAGLERTIWNLKEHFQVSEDWTTDNINEVEVAVAVGDENGVLLYPLSNDGEVNLDPGSYKVKLEYVYDAGDPNPKKDVIRVRSRGTVKEISKTVQVEVRAENISAWNNAIFAKAGTAVDAIIEGNAKIHGSVHLLGEGLGDTDLALDMTGVAGIRNNYVGMPEALRAKVPVLEKISFGDEEVESLNAVLRVQNGLVGLSGTATVGKEDEPGNDFKETVDAAYVTDGYGGNQAEANVYADTEGGYDLTEGTVPFPSLDEPYQSFDTYFDYLEDLYLGRSRIVIPGNKISSDDYFSDGDAMASIDWDWDGDQGKAILKVEGVVWVEGNSLDISELNQKIEYRGSGVIVVAESLEGEISGEIRVHGDLIAERTFPTDDVLGLVTNRLELATGEGESQVTMTGAFFADQGIISQKQNEIAGTFVSAIFDMGQNVPRIYQVPKLADCLPPGMPGDPKYWSVTTKHWSETSWSES